MADHPVKVPEELAARLWIEAEEKRLIYGSTRIFAFANLITQWAADQELEACCEWIEARGYSRVAAGLRTARRPKPPTLAEQGLKALRSTPCTEQRHYDAMFAALTRLAELEAQQ